MLNALTQVTILYIIAIIGFICHKTGLFTEKAAKMTTDLLFYIVTPATIIRSFVEMSFSKENLKSLWLALLGGFVFHAIAIIFSELAYIKSKGENLPILKFGAVYGNVGYMGIPLSNAIVGTEGVFYSSASIIVFNIMAFTHGIFIMTKGDRNKKFNIKSLLLNPGIIAIVIGLPLFLLNVNLPQILGKPLDHIANIQTPLAMLMFGTFLATADWKSVFKEKRIMLTAFIKLIATPLLTLVTLKAIGFSGALLVSCVLASSAPTATNTVLFSAKFDKNTALASSMTAIVSLISVITMPVMIALSQTV